MTRLVWVGVVAIGLLLLWPLGAWVLARIARRYGTDPIVAAAIKTPRSLHEGLDADLRARTLKRRETADSYRRRAAHVESGASASDLLRIVKR